MTQALPLQQAAAGKPNRQERRRAEKQARKVGRAEGLRGELAKAHGLHLAGRLPEAEALYHEVLEREPENQAALARLGALCGQTDRPDQAVVLLQKAVAIDPQDASSQINLGVIYAGQERIEEADASFRQAARLDPDNTQTQKCYGDWCYRQGRLAEGVEILEAALKRAPKDAARQATLARGLAGLARLDEAGEAFRKALALTPNDPEILGDYGLLLAQSGKTGEALEPLALGFARAKVSDDYQKIFAEVLQECHLDRPLPALERAFITCFEAEQVDLQRMSPAVGAYLWTRTMAAARVEDAGDGKSDRVHLDGILADRLMLLLLTKVVNTHLGLEALLVSLRRSLLGKVIQDPAALRNAKAFMCSFAMQCHNNSYVFPTNEVEQAAIAELAAEIATATAELERPDQDFEIRLVAYAMYHPLHHLGDHERLSSVPLEAWSAEMQALMRRALLEPGEEQHLKPSIATFGQLDDAVTQAVRTQYEESPYPRWITLSGQVPVACRQYLRHNLPWAEIPEIADADLPCLIAGCGTGRHPISFALRLPQARVTAIDLSRASLAYAKRKAVAYGATNIEFLHGDLQQIRTLGQRFRVIESSGVLHHLEEPERGLRSLLEVLVPDGYLRLGLYSRTARHHINRHREQIKALGLEPDATALRAYRWQMIAAKDPAVANLARVNDFFDLDGFRDLLFHVQEHQFTIPEIGALLARNGLKFLGFTNVKRSHLRRFAERNPGPEAMADLKAWETFEAENPNCFLGMYEFWCRRTAVAESARTS